jgi:hypothetical protein
MKRKLNHHRDIEVRVVQQKTGKEMVKKKKGRRGIWRGINNVCMSYDKDSSSGISMKHYSLRAPNVICKSIHNH